MSDFLKDLDAKAYALVAGSIDLEEFSSWYRLASAARAKPVAIKASQLEPAPIPVRQTKGEDPEDSYRPAEPRLDNMNGPDPDWAVGTGDRKQWPPG